MTCARCEAHAVRIAELEEELAAWKAYRADEANLAGDLERLDRWRRAFRVTASRALMLMLMVERAGSIVTRRQLVAAASLAPGSGSSDPDDRNPKVADVYLCRIREALARHHLGKVETVWGCGWRMSAETAAAVKAFVGEGAAA